ncbi:MAG: glycosyltransferase family 1 protein, partial [bacterium]
VYWLKVGLYKMLVKIVAHRAKKILTVSQFSAKDIEKYLGVKVEKIEVIYNGVDALPKSDMALAGEWKKQLGITKPFLFYVGSAYPHKNLEKLIDAMLLIKQHHDVQLVLGGKKNYFYQQLQKYITDKNLTADVILVDYLNDEQLAKMYRLAQLYVFPSLIEGFGLPPLEAQASDCPVVASNYSCLPEVLGDSVVYFDPTKTEAIAQAVNTVLADDTLREKLITLGKNNWPKYTWGRCAQEVLKVYLGK